MTAQLRSWRPGAAPAIRRRVHGTTAAPVGLLAATLLLAALLLPLLAAPAAAQDRTLSLYNTHTHERLTVTYKRNGRFVQAGLDQLNRFLRDWRRDEVTRMDPALFDIVWQVYRDVGASQPIHVVSAYRSPATNDMLRRRSSGVADNSQHTRGRAMDFFIPGVSAAALRAAGLRQQAGGVGYYPTAGTPFVHLDTGSVRMWPRMTRDQLSRVFPDGRTIHMPADGRPMPGYDQALRDLQRRGGGGGATIAVASASTSEAAARDEGDGDIVLPGEGEGNFFAALFGGNRARDEETRPAAQPAPRPAAQPAPQPVAQPAPAAPAPVEVAAVAPSEGPRSPWSAPAPVLPPNAPATPGLAPSTVAGLAVPPPVPAPTIDELQVAAATAAAAAIVPPPVPAPAALEATFAAAQGATPAADLPPITREAQIAQALPAENQIAAIIEARFAEQRAQEAALAAQVAQAIASRSATTPAAEVAAAGPRFVPPVPTPVQLARPSDAPIALAAVPPPPAPTPLASAFTAPAAVAPGQSAIASATGTPLPQAPVVAPVLPPAAIAAAPLVTGSTAATARAAAPLHPVSADLGTTLTRQSIRGGAHAQLVAPAPTVDLSPVIATQARFVPDRPFTARSDGFGARSLTGTHAGSALR